MPSLRRVLPLLLTVLLVAGCTTSREAANPAPPAAEEPPPEAPADEPSPAPEPAPAEEENQARVQAPTDWQHQSRANGYPGIGTERAYAFLDGRAPDDTVVVAVIDAGVDPDHEDLDAVLWTNRDEVPGNERDDDQNGYVDDVHGWNFIGGADGRNVEHDTYEVTRLYAKLREKYEGVDPETLSGEEREAYERYQEIKADYQRQKRRYSQQYAQIQRIAGFIEQARPLVEAELEGDGPITLERLQSIGPGAGQRVQQAVQLFTTFLQRSGAPNVEAVVQDIQKAEEQMRTRVEYNFNPDYDPRSIVGDDFSDATERIYGNPDVEGPDAGHGTAVASLIAAERGNDLGLRGVASAVKIMPVRTVPGGDERDKDVANAIRYAVDNGADIVNMSFGKAYSPRKEVVDTAVQHADEEGVLLVHAAGNDAADIDTGDNFPSAYYAEDAGVAENWIEVGASSAQGDSLLAASFSNYGDERVDLFAPGAQVYVARPGNNYGRSQGTSLAAPIVTGVAALVMAYYPDLSASQVKQVLLTSATDYAGTMVQQPGESERVRFGTLSRTGGIVNAYAALRAAEQMAGD